MTRQTSFNEDLNPERLELLKDTVHGLSQDGSADACQRTCPRGILKNIYEPANQLRLQLYPVMVQDASNELAESFGKT